MVSKESRKAVRSKKHWRMRKTLVGTSQKPRLSVFRSNSHMYAQIIDDSVGKTLAAASTLEKEAKSALENTAPIEAAAYVGKLIAERALAKGIEEVVFDRGGYIYHGRVMELAEGARAGGLKF